MERVISVLKFLHVDREPTPFPCYKGVFILAFSFSLLCERSWLPFHHVGYILADVMNK